MKVLQAGMTPEEVSKTPIETQAIQAYMAKHPGASTWDASVALKKVVPAFRFEMMYGGMNGMTPGPGFVGSGKDGAATIRDVPDQVRGTVQSILDYRQAMPPLSRNNPMNQAMQQWVNRIDPTYDAGKFPQRQKFMMGLEQGADSKTLDAINTGLGHVGVLADAIKALNNGDTKVLNQIGNAFNLQFSADDNLTKFKTIVNRVGPELSAAYIQGGGGEGERGTTKADFDPSLSPGKLQGNVQITAKLLRSKIGSMENRYKTDHGPG